jgi:phage baseplate assembly protein gpV
MTEETKTELLPILSVKTKHSQYLIDQNTGTYARTRVHEDANDLSWAGILDGEKTEYRDWAMPGVGQSMMIVHADGTWLRSTAVESIEHLSE